jgi:cell wall-associated NlpC family hydrolase
VPAKTALAAAISAPLLVVALLAAVAAAITATPDTGAIPTCAVDAAADTTSLSPTQLANAQLIAQVGISMGVPMPGETIAIATALQESTLLNLDHGDRDSLGLFQQRPSQGWGTRAQILTPAYAARQFYTHLLQVPGWRAMPTTQAVQAVQHSAYPDAYAKWQGQAEALAARFTGTPACSPADSGDGTAEITAVNAAGYSIPAGTPAPIAAVLTFALAQLGKPYEYGTAGPSTYDCSGLVQAAYAGIGVHLPRTTSQQVTVGRPVLDAAQLQAGDLLFIPGADGTPQDPGHVGIYLGRGLLIQAPKTGDVVKISPLKQWTASLTAIRRAI